MTQAILYANDKPQDPYFAERFPTYGDIVGRTASIMNVKNVCNAELVCRAWATAFSSDPVWAILTDRDLCRGVENHTKKYKQVYSTLYPKTYGRAMFRKWLGDIDTPVVRKDRYEQFFISEDFDPFAPEKKLKEAYSLVFIAPHVYRPNDEKALYNGKTLCTILMEEVTEEDKPTIENNEMRIPLTLRNLIRLVETLHPKTKIFDYKNPKVLKQCNAPVKKPEAWIMRDEVVLRNTPYFDQKNTVEKTPIGKETFKLCPLLVRILYSMFEILEKGDCPDNRNSFTYARTASTVRIGDKDLPVDFGGFAPGAGAHVPHRYYDAYDSVGVPPAVPAEV
jgi:hypothetical protein